MEVLKQFVPSLVCLNCEGCCRFKEEKSVWRPRITDAEKKHIDENAAGIVDSSWHDGQGSIETVSCDTGHCCRFFRTDDRTCSVYALRPFECRLYPFVIGKKEGALFLYFHLSCPYIQEHQAKGIFREYADYLQGFFLREDVRAYLKDNYGSFPNYSSYQNEMEPLFILMEKCAL